jgi:hypothetical protein
VRRHDGAVQLAAALRRSTPPARGGQNWKFAFALSPRFCYGGQNQVVDFAKNLPSFEARFRSRVTMADHAQKTAAVDRYFGGAS